VKQTQFILVVGTQVYVATKQWYNEIHTCYKGRVQHLFGTETNLESIGVLWKEWSPEIVILLDKSCACFRPFFSTIRIEVCGLILG